jgi:hypothetical protein
MTLRTTAIAALTSLALLTSHVAALAQAESSDDGRYQIVRASENRVWRLDRQTGEIAVCTLEGDRLVCSTSSEAVSPPETSYESLQTERAQEEEAEAERQIAFLDRMLKMIREMMAYAIRQDQGSGGEPAE